MGDAVEDERLRGLAEADLLVEAAGVLLSFDDDAVGAEVLAGGLDAFEHHPPPVALAADGGDDASDGHLIHVRPGGADAAEGDDLVAFRKPKMDRSLVVAVEVLVDAVLLDDEYVGADPEELVEFVEGQFLKGLLVEYGFGGFHRKQR